MQQAQNTVGSLAMLALAIGIENNNLGGRLFAHQVAGAQFRERAPFDQRAQRARRAERERRCQVDQRGFIRRLRLRCWRGVMTFLRPL